MGVNRRVINSTIQEKQPRMTCIIGAKCNDGVVLIADRKVIDDEPGKPEWREKLYEPYYPMVIGSSGGTDAFDKVRERAGKKAIEMHLSLIPQEGFPVSGRVSEYPISDTQTAIDLNRYLDSLREIVKTTNEEYKKADYPVCDILFATWINGWTSRIYYISEKGAQETIDKYRIIGTGEGHADVFLKPLWRDGMSMKSFAMLSCFIIKYIEKFEINSKIGVGKDKPQVWFISNEDKSYEAKIDFLNHLETGINATLEKFESTGIIDLSAFKSAV